MLGLALSIYLLGLIFVGGVMTIGLVRFGGFTRYTELSNSVSGRKREVHEVEWIVVTAVLLWPVLLYAAYKLRKGEK